MKKKTLFVLLLLHISLCLTAQKVIHMERENGVFKISCLVNGARMKMIFDTGAAQVSLSKSMASYLYDNDYITDDDIIGEGKSRTADGSTINHVIVNLKDIEISGLHIYNVKASVIDGQNAPLLLGQTAIQKLGSITIDGNDLIVNEAFGQLSDEELDNLAEELNSYLENNSFRAALDILYKFEENVGPSSEIYKWKAYCLFQTHEIQKCIDNCLKWDKYAGGDKTNEHKALCYEYLCECYQSNEIDNNKEALKWGEKALLADKNSLERLPWDYKNLSFCHSNLNHYEEAVKYGKLAITSQLKLIKATSRNVLKGLVKDDNLRWFYYSLGMVYYLNDDEINAAEQMVYSAMMDYDSAIEYCVKHNIKYKVKANEMLNR